MLWLCFSMLVLDDICLCDCPKSRWERTRKSVAYPFSSRVRASPVSRTWIRKGIRFQRKDSTRSWMGFGYELLRYYSTHERKASVGNGMNWCLKKKQELSICAVWELISRVWEEYAPIEEYRHFEVSYSCSIGRLLTLWAMCRDCVCGSLLQVWYHTCIILILLHGRNNNRPSERTASFSRDMSNKVRIWS